MPTRNHVSTMVRTPNGNDYGKDFSASTTSDSLIGDRAFRSGDPARGCRAQVRLGRRRRVWGIAGVANRADEGGPP